MLILSAFINLPLISYSNRLTSIDALEKENEEEEVPLDDVVTRSSPTCLSRHFSGRWRRRLQQGWNVQHRAPSFLLQVVSLSLSLCLCLCLYNYPRYLFFLSVSFPYFDDVSFAFFLSLILFLLLFLVFFFFKIFSPVRARRSMVFLNFWKSDFLLFLFSLRLVTSFLFLFLSSYTFPALVSCSPMYIFYFILLFITGTKES